MMAKLINIHEHVTCLLLSVMFATLGAAVTRQPQLVEPKKQILDKPKNSYEEPTSVREDLTPKVLLKTTFKFALEQLFLRPESFNVLHPLRKLAYDGDPGGHLYIGFMHSFGLGGLERSQAKALMHYTFAAIGGCEQAQMILAYRYHFGRSVSKNCEVALDLYRRVAKIVEDDRTQNSRSAFPLEKIRLSDESDDPSGPTTNQLDRDLLQYYQFLADKGDVKAQVGLGQLLFQGGRNVPRDHVRAFRYLSRATTAGDSNAMALLGKMYLEGSDAVAQSNATALKYFSMSAEKGNPYGQTGLAKMYRLGSGVPVDYSQALKLLKLAAEQGFLEAHVELGHMFYFGIGVEKSYPVAFKYFQQALMQGHTSAFYYLGLMNGQGTGVVRNCHNAVDLLKEVAERGPWMSFMQEAYKAYSEGRMNEALIRYMFVAELGSEVAQSNAAHVLTNTNPVLYSANASLALAIRFWQMAADQGSPAARLKLGDAYFYGYGVPADYNEALQYYRLAGEDNFRPSAQALFNLGLMHEYGQGVPADNHLARRYYHLAATASEDAQVPAQLALFKMALAEMIKRMRSLQWIETTMSGLLGDNWDLYMMAIFMVFLVILRYMRSYLF
ncbi:protein sel-1 homolog 1-like [Varroa jacobsoni]|uniref:protein sel-1 homolog 1-like n=1 Tax=Varroa jacobsoni TaxID=62625 RepID=UPI000BFA4F9C|nr:protein sel-1 homolog 1-like [Varroa jacobsoni]